jgi:hypothetical protein
MAHQAVARRQGVVLERLRVAGGVSAMLATGLGAVVFATRLSAPQSAPAGAAEAPDLVVVVPIGGGVGDRIDVEFEGGKRGVVTVPAGLSEGSSFRVRPPQQARSSGLAGGQISVLRGGLIGLTVGRGIVLSPFVLYGGTSTAKILAPICTLPIAATLVATGVYLGRAEQQLLAEKEMRRLSDSIARQIG